MTLLAGSETRKQANMKKTILHLDDEAEIRELLSQYLSARGYRVIPVASPTEALKAIRQETPDLIITDLQLEDADGLEVVEQFRQVLPNTPVILLTGVLIDPHVAAETVGTKVAAYIEKTASLTKLVDEVKRLVGE